MIFFAITSPFGVEDIQIDADRYDNLLKSRKILGGALALEEKFDLLVSNYLDLESECLNCALQRVMICTIPGHSFKSTNHQTRSS